jgi:hypothetical protein
MPKPGLVFASKWLVSALRANRRPNGGNSGWSCATPAGGSGSQPGQHGSLSFPLGLVWRVVPPSGVLIFSRKVQKALLMFVGTVPLTPRCPIAIPPLAQDRRHGLRGRNACATTQLRWQCR